MKTNKIYITDCLTGIKSLPDKSIDIVFTDPPYNRKKKYDNYDDNLSNEEYLIWMKQIIDELKRIVKKGMIFYVDGDLTKTFLNLIPDAELVIVHKRAAGICKNNYAKQYHSIITNVNPVKRMRNVWTDIRLPGEGYFFREQRFDCPGMTSQLLTEKILQYFTNENDIVLDIFNGTGTTSVACKNMNRKFIGFEQSKKYCLIAKQRLSISVR